MTVSFCKNNIYIKDKKYPLQNDSKLKVPQIYTKQKLILNFWTFDFVSVSVRWRSEWDFELLILYLTKMKFFIIKLFL